MNSQAQSKSSKYTVVGRGQGELGSRALREFPEVGAPLRSLDVPCVRARAWGPNTFRELKDSWLGNRVERPRGGGKRASCPWPPTGKCRVCLLLQQGTPSQVSSKDTPLCAEGVANRVIVCAACVILNFLEATSKRKKTKEINFSHIFYLAQDV